MKSWIVRVGVGLAVGALLALAGCGDSELSRAEYVKRVGAVCRDANTRINAIAAPNPTDNAAVAGTVDQLVKIQRDEVTKIEAISPNRDDRDAVREWLELVRSALDQTQAAADALRTGDRAAFDKAVQGAANASADADERAARIGLTQCASPPNTITTTTTTTTIPTTTTIASTSTTRSATSTTAKSSTTAPRTTASGPTTTRRVP